MSQQFNSPGKQFRAALAAESPLQIVGTINAYSALLAKNAGFRAIYLSGSGVASQSYGLPDLGMTSLTQVLEDVWRITSICDLPLLVDIDTGWGHVFNIGRTIQQMIKAGAAAVHIEDQVEAKRCGHRPNKQIVAKSEMVDRLKSAVDAKYDPDFVIIARTDALANEGLAATIERIQAYIVAGADMIFFEGVTDLSQYQALTQAISVPVLANITEFGVTPLYTREALAEVGVKLILYPLSASRAMAKAATEVYDTIRQQGTQQAALSLMQTRKELYSVLNYHAYEDKLDQLFGKENNHE